MQSSKPPDMATNSSWPGPRDPLVRVGGLTIQTTNYTKQELREYINWQASINDDRIMRSLATIEKARSENEEFRYFLNRMENNEFWMKKPAKSRSTRGSSGAPPYTGNSVMPVPMTFVERIDYEGVKGLTVNYIDTIPKFDTSIPPPILSVPSSSKMPVSTQSCTSSNVNCTSKVETVGERKQNQKPVTLALTTTSETPAAVPHVISDSKYTELENGIPPTTPAVVSNNSHVLCKPEHPDLENTIVHPITSESSPDISHIVGEPGHIKLENVSPPNTPVIKSDISHVVGEPEKPKPVNNALATTSPKSFDSSPEIQAVRDLSNTSIETNPIGSELVEIDQMSQPKNSQNHKKSQNSTKTDERMYKAKPLTLADYLSPDVRSSVNPPSSSDAGKNLSQEPKTKVNNGHVLNNSVGMDTLNQKHSSVPSSGRSFADVVKQRNGGSVSSQSPAITLPERPSFSDNKTPDEHTEKQISVVETCANESADSEEAKASQPEPYSTSRPEVVLSNLQASSIKKEALEKLGEAQKDQERAKKATPLQDKRNPRKKKQKQSLTDLEDEFGITEIEKKERKAKLIMKTKYEFYLKDQPRIRNEEDDFALDNLPEICSPIYDRVLCSKERYSFEKYSPRVVQSFIEENKKRNNIKKKGNSKISDDKQVRTHILPLFFTVISEMRDVNVHRNWIDADVRHMMKHQEIDVYYRAATDYIGHVSWDRIESYMERQCIARKINCDPEGARMSAIERELMMAARKTTFHHSMYTESDFFTERRAHYKKEFESSPKATLYHLYYVILGTGWHNRLDYFKDLVHVLNFDFFYLSQLSRLPKTDIGRKESDYLKMFFYV